MKKGAGMDDDFQGRVEVLGSANNFVRGKGRRKIKRGSEVQYFMQCEGHKPKYGPRNTKTVRRDVAPWME